MDFKSLKLLRSKEGSNRESTLKSSSFFKIGSSKKHLKLMENELDNIHLIQYLDSITEEDEMVITIDLRKKTLKRLLQHLKDDNEDIDKSTKINGMTQEHKNSITNLFMNENSGVDQKDEPVSASLNLTADQKNELYLKFKSNIESKDTSIKFEIEQIINDVFLQATHKSTSQSNKKYKKYVSLYSK